MTPEQSIYMTDKIVDLVESTYVMLQHEWHQQLKRSYFPVGYRRDIKTVRLQLARRCGATTAAKRLWDAHPNALLYFPREIECSAFRRNHGIAPSLWPDRIYALSHDTQRVIDKQRGMSPDWYLHDLVIFDGYSRMKREIVDEMCDYHDPYTNLFVLLG